MPLDVIMPALGMAQETGQIVAWHKRAGEAVAKGDILFEVETDKATMEVEAQGDGYLTDVSAKEGTDVPVGNVIARISETADAAAQSSDTDAEPAPAPDAAPDTSDDLPDGKAVIMPTLGMAQDTGLLVAWHKVAGDAVDADDVLFEVETDKSTVEVNAGSSGYLAAVLAAEGEEVPVGQTIAIISDKAPENPVTRKAAQAAAPAAAPAPAKPQPHTKDKAPAAPQKMPAPQTPQAGGRILASPKARRLAHEQGLDLSRLVAAGYAQPYHARDIDTLRSLPAPSQAAPAGVRTDRRITADIATEGFSGFADWAAETADLTDSAALLAGLCAASMGHDATVAVETFGHSVTYAASARLGATEKSDAPPELRLRDLRSTSITSVDTGSDDIPTLTLCRAGQGLAITLEYAGDQFAPQQAITLLNNFAGRMEQPLRHLF